MSDNRLEIAQELFKACANKYLYTVFIPFTWVGNVLRGAMLGDMGSPYRPPIVFEFDNEEAAIQYISSALDGNIEVVL